MQSFLKAACTHLLAVCLFTTMLNAQGETEPDSIVIHQAEQDSLLAQSPQSIAIEAAAAVRFASSAHGFVRWSPVQEASGYRLRYRPVNTVSWQTVYVTQSEALLTNLSLDQKYVLEVIPEGVTDAEAYQSDVGVLSTFAQTEPIGVSDRFYNLLSAWFANEEQEGSFCDFLQSAPVSMYEKLSFLQVYAFDNAAFQPASQSASLTDWYPSGSTGTASECLPVWPAGCNCKVITRGNILPTPYEKIQDSTGVIIPKKLQKIVKGGGDRTFVDRFESGAAKYVALRQDEGSGGMSFSMSNLPGADDTSAVTTASSRIQFFLGCIRNGGFTTNLPASCSCERPLKVEYEYSTRLHVLADKKFCFWSKGSAAQAEDMAFVVAYEGKTGNLTPLKAGRAILGRWCNSSWNPDFWIEVVDLLNPVGQYYARTLDTTISNNRVPTQNQIDQFAQALQDLIQTPFNDRSGQCDDNHVQRDETLVAGSNTLMLRPNGPIRIDLFSAYYVRTRGYGCYRAEAAVASDYYLMGVVESELTADPECCTDKYVAYITGSQSVPPNGDVEVDAVHTIGERLQQVGFNMAAYGDWYGMSYNSLGNIQLTREYDRMYGPSCETDGNEFGGAAAERTSGGVTSGDMDVFPTIVQDYVHINFQLAQETLCSISLLDMNGRPAQHLHGGHLPPGDHSLRFPVQRLPAGTYLLQCRLGDQVKSRKIILH